MGQAGTRARHVHDAEVVEVVLPSEIHLIPRHRPFQAVHGVAELALCEPLGEHGQLHLPAAHGGEGGPQRDEVAGHQPEEVGRFFPRVLEYRKVPCPPGRSPEATLLPLPRSTGHAALSASMRHVYVVITSGRSKKGQICRNELASHCVQNTPLDWYNPCSDRLAFGSCAHLVVSSKSWRGGGGGGVGQRTAETAGTAAAAATPNAPRPWAGRRAPTV